MLGADLKNKYQPIASLVQKVWQQGQGNQRRTPGVKFEE